MGEKNSIFIPQQEVSIIDFILNSCFMEENYSTDLVLFLVALVNVKFSIVFLFNPLISVHFCSFSCCIFFNATFNTNSNNKLLNKNIFSVEIFSAIKD